MKRVVMLVSVVLCVFAAYSIWHAVSVARQVKRDIVAPTTAAVSEYYSNTERTLDSMGEGVK